MADIAIATHFASLKQVGYEVDATKWPTLTQYLQRVFNREAFKECFDKLE